MAGLPRLQMRMWNWVTSSPTEPELVVGIDPSLRHTGLALDRGPGQPPVYHEIKTGSIPVVEAVRFIRAELTEWLCGLGLDREMEQLRHPVRPPGKARIVWALEQQMAQADVNGWLMLTVQVAVCEVIQAQSVGQVQMVAPYPNQLKAYIRRAHGVNPRTKSEIRYGQRRILRERVKSGEVPLVSSHKAEAWFLTQLARDVLAGRWSYKQSPVKVKVFPWQIIRGESR